MIGERDVDIITGDDGDDKVIGGKGDDHLDGGKGSDEINGGEGADIMIGGLGADTFICDEFDKIMDFGSIDGDKKIGSCLVVNNIKSNTTQLGGNTTIQ